MEEWSPTWSTPVFSMQERDQRWSGVRALMAAAGIDVLVCLPGTNSHNHGQADVVYLTQLGENEDEVTVVFPVDGDVTAWLSRGGAWPASNWLTDIRAAPRGTGGRTVVDRVRELGLERGTIGVAGLTGGVLAHARETEGEVNWQSVEMIKRELPDARVVSGTDLLGEARYQKSEEEVAFIHRGVQIAEKVIDVIVEKGRAGVRERELFGWMLYTHAAEGGSFPPMIGWSSGPLGATYHRVEVPTFRSLQQGDVLSLEIEGRWGGYIAQLDQTFSVGSAHQDLADGMKLACESYDRVMERMKAGVTVGELLDASAVTGMGGRGAARLTMHGRGTGDDGPLVTSRITPELRAVELQEGCVMILKPAASVDGKPDYGRWGESVVVRRDRAERLGSRPQGLLELM